VPAPHTYDATGDELYDSLVDWNLDEKVSTITLDNCTTNDSSISYLVRKIRKNKLLGEGKFLHMCCCAHILNLIVKDGLEMLKDATEHFRDSVAYWTATPKREEKFEEIAKYVMLRLIRRYALIAKHDGILLIQCLVLHFPTRLFLLEQVVWIGNTLAALLSRNGHLLVML
jgi:hypothetical protein